MIIGIDCGQTGAIAALHDGLIVALHDMPVMARTHGKGQQVDPYALATIIFEMISVGKESTEAVIEQVSAMPGQGSVSMFNFGEGVGVVKGVLGALQVSVRFVRPQYWKGKAGLKNAEKDAARAMAIQLHPEVADQLTRKKDIGRADSIMIAHFG